MLEQSKTSLAQERPRVAAQIMLSELTGSRYIHAERLFQYRHECLLQEERLRQPILTEFLCMVYHLPEVAGMLVLSHSFGM